MEPSQQETETQKPPLLTILNTPIYVVAPEVSSPEKTPTYNILTAEQRQQLEEKPPIVGELYVFQNRDNNNQLTIEVRFNDLNKGIEPLQQLMNYLNGFDFDSKIQIRLVVGKGMLITTYEDLKKILSDPQKTNEQIVNLSVRTEIQEVSSYFETVAGRLLNDDTFLINLYQNPENALNQLKQTILEKHQRLTETQQNKLEELIASLKERISKIREQIEPQKAIELLSLSEKKIVEKISQLPTIPNDFYQPLIPPSDQSLVCLIDPENIITAVARNTGTEGSCWTDYFIDRSGRNIPYMKNLIQSFLNGKYPFLEKPSEKEGMEPVVVIHLGNGKYLVESGRHRIIATKLLGAKGIYCQVRELSVQTGERRKIDSNKYYQLKHLIQLGKIKGHIEEENGEKYIIFEEPPNRYFLFENPQLAQEILQEETK